MKSTAWVHAGIDDLTDLTDIGFDAVQQHHLEWGGCWCDGFTDATTRQHLLYCSHWICCVKSRCLKMVCWRTRIPTFRPKQRVHGFNIWTAMDAAFDNGADSAVKLELELALNNATVGTAIKINNSTLQLDVLTTRHPWQHLELELLLLSTRRVESPGLLLILGRASDLSLMEALVDWTSASLNDSTGKYVVRAVIPHSACI